MSLIQNRFTHLFDYAKEDEKVNPYKEKVSNLYSPKNYKEQTNPYLNSGGRLAENYLNFEGSNGSENATSKTRELLKQAADDNIAAIKNRNSENAANTQNINTTTSSGGTGQLGFISSKYETGGWNPGKVSSGSGDYGGISYGIPQFSTTTGSADSFVNWLKQTNPEMGNYFGNSKAGTGEFSNAWSNVSSQYGNTFGNIQTQYAYDRFVKPLASLAKQKTGIDYTRSPALTELVYSTAIQFGGGSLGLSALGNASTNMSDKDIVNASYDKKINNVGSFFKSSSQQVQNSVKNRFANERNDVLALLGSGNTANNTNSKTTNNTANNTANNTGSSSLKVGSKVANTSGYKNSAAVGQCVWYVRGRMKEKLGKDTGAVGNGNQMWHNASDSAKLPATINSIKPNTVASYQTGTSSGGAKYGHVIYIEDVVGDTVYYTEGGSGYYKNGTDGTVKTASKQGILNGINSSGSQFGNGLIGFIDVSRL